MKNEVVKAFRTKLAAAGTDERMLELFYSEFCFLFSRGRFSRDKSEEMGLFRFKLLFAEKIGKEIFFLGSF